MTNCFGHDGSTGVTAWVDKDKKIAFIIVSNTGHPKGDNNLFDSYKPKIIDAILTALGY
jgi:CubicO group peptidase (beta-lactamase class C family)